MTKFLFSVLSIIVLLTGCTSSGDPGLNNATDSDSPSKGSTQADQETQAESDSGSESESSEVEKVNTDQSQLVSKRDFEAAIAKADVDYDEFDEQTSFRIYPESGLDTRAVFYITVYLQSDGRFEAALNTGYQDEDWIFFEFLDIRFQDETYQIYQAQSFDKFTDVLSGGYVQEFYLYKLTKDQIDLMDEIAAEGAAKLRLVGDGDSIQRDFTASEIDAFKTILTIYRGLEQGLEYQNGA